MKTFQIFKSAFQNLHLYLREHVIIKNDQVTLISSKNFQTSKSFKLQENLGGH